MKKALLMILNICILLVVCCSCTDFNSGKRPFDYEPGIWRSENPKAWFEVKSYHMVYDDYGYPEGELELDGVMVHIVLVFDYGNGVQFYRDSRKRESNYMFMGQCKFSPTELKVKVSDNPEILKGEFTELIFKKVT